MRRNVHLRRAARRDGNEPAIIEALEKAGCLVWQSSELSDLIVHRPEWGKFVMLQEVKNPKGRGRRYTKAQLGAREDGWPIVTDETPEDALRAVGLLP